MITERLFFASYTGLVLAISPLVAANLVNPEMKIIKPIRNDPIYFASHPISLGLFTIGFVGSSLLYSIMSHARDEFIE